MYNEIDVAFKVDDISQSDMNSLANCLEDYLMLFKDVLIIPRDVCKKDSKKVQESIETVEKLIKKLRKGDKGVFKEDDD